MVDRAVITVISWWFHHADSIVRILLFRFPCANFIVQIYYINYIVWIPSSNFHYADSLVQIFLCRFHCADSIVQVLSYGCHIADPMVRIRFFGFNHVHSIVRIPLSAFYCMHSIVQWTKERRGKRRWWVSILTNCIHICICIAVDGNRDVSSKSVLGESLSTWSASTRLYSSYCICVVDYQILILVNVHYWVRNWKLSRLLYSSSTSSSQRIIASS